MSAAQRMCVPLNESFEISGKLSTNQRKVVALRIKTCNSSLNSSRPCANQTLLTSLMSTTGSFIANLYYVNPLINPGNTEYIDYEVNDINYLSFNLLEGTAATGIVEDFTI